MFNALAFNCDYKDAIGECFFGYNIFLIFFNVFFLLQVRLMRPLIGARPALANKS